ncbi:MAG: EAL domain-containing protein [Bacteroides sp.]|nr:EAL domain-containing protein [Eubacterium sp.]MCM1418547.1 EAL domain-containing protein [Roseburia sp.]MCM1462571.1 EAL domain-containing protein [Bacteroides sp.]
MIPLITEDERQRAARIEEAIEAREFKAYYQPQYDAVTSRLMSAEALVRWIKPDGALVPPDEFIPLAEKTSVVTEIDWYMLEEVCRFLRRRGDEGLRRVPVAVNFSRKHIGAERFTERLRDTVDRYAIPHELIEVEITESAMVSDPKEIISFVAEVREAGFNVAIDDFGSGFSSLSLVKDISANVLKIDRSLLSGNCENEKERIVLESIFEFAHRLKLTTIAEGVETREQLGFLRTCDCRLIQGFLFSRPLPEAAFAAALDEAPEDAPTEDILVTQAPSSVTSLLMEAIFTRFPLVIVSNLTRNSFYMMAYENFSATSCPSTGVFDELIAHGASSMHPEDQALFRETFAIPNLLAAHGRGEKYVKVVTRQLGDDGVYRRVETTDYFVKNPAVDDVLIIALCQNLDD